MPDDAEHIRFERDGSVATITLDRPDKLNTITMAMARRLAMISSEINLDDQIHAVIVSGVGERAFCAGSDVTMLGDFGSVWKMRNRFDARTDYVRSFWEIRKPVVAAVDGYCIGGGLEIALTCDVRLATPDAQFAAGEVKLGWHAGSGETQLLPRVVGFGNAMRLLLTGDRIDAREAFRLGLVQEIVERPMLRTAARNLADRIARNPPIAVQLTKHIARMSLSTSVEVGMAYENDLYSFCMTTQDSQEGIAAFSEKREPRFTGE